MKGQTGSEAERKRGWFGGEGGGGDDAKDIKRKSSKINLHLSNGRDLKDDNSEPRKEVEAMSDKKT